jgi:hypothetical protein
MSSNSFTFVLDESLKNISLSSRIEFPEYNGGVEKKNIEINKFLGSNGLHSFIHMLHVSFSYHIPLILKPDDFWTIIIQGLGEHINKNPDKFQNKFVTFQGKKDLIIERDGFILGSQNNNWDGVFEEFSQEISKNCKQDSVLLEFVQKFSTTTPLNTVVYNISLMSAAKDYFNYCCSTLCGIPNITLQGTVEDWKKLEIKLNNFKLSELDYELLEWDANLKWIISKIVATRCEEALDIDFWKSIYKFNSMSGGDRMTGWTCLLFPILCKDWQGKTRNFFGAGISYSSIPTGLSICPFIWNYMGVELPMKIIAGFDEPKISDTSIESRYGYAIMHDK